MKLRHPAGCVRVQLDFSSSPGGNRVVCSDWLGFFLSGRSPWTESPPIDGPVCLFTKKRRRTPKRTEAQSRAATTEAAKISP